MIKPPCGANCPNRVPPNESHNGCHSFCEKWLEYERAKQEELDYTKAEREAILDTANYYRERAEKTVSHLLRQRRNYSNRHKGGRR